MPTGILRWEDPAPTKPARDDYAPIAAELRNKPGEWAVVAEHPADPDGRRASARLFSAVKNGYLGFRRVEDGTYKAATRTVAADDGTKVITVHAMFVRASR
ncbi:hypothetical protein ACGF0J_14150 [Nonomuraea sp. NPDC047897]|uniref:hypothetical protein n=1 Tax=Nonomuraea sp. NPDC047897 TaxID=3364346 RepID=UPI00371B8FFF